MSNARLPGYWPHESYDAMFAAHEVTLAADLAREKQIVKDLVAQHLEDQSIANAARIDRIRHARAANRRAFAKFAITWVIVAGSVALLLVLVAGAVSWAMGGAGARADAVTGASATVSP